jgi:cytochrome b subunit of formate dehydrogenase
MHALTYAPSHYRQKIDKKINRMNHKYHQFESAIEKYQTVSWYKHIQTVLSWVVICAQVLSLINLVQTYTTPSFLGFIATLICAYLATDFINGLVHMLMDNNTHYTSSCGPMIAYFHLHHYKLNYQEKHPVKIYFYESGYKVWLVFYLLLLIYLQHTGVLPCNLNLGLVAFGILSSFAELSHYWCHQPTTNHGMIRFLQKYRLLLSLEHHRLHHVQDNTHYAFLNGISNPLLNVIARVGFKGYKNYSDQYVRAYFKKHQHV